MNFLPRCLSYTECSGAAGRNETRGGESSNGGFGKDGLLWFHDIGNFGSGEFSMAIVQANQVLEDQSQIESGPFGTFVGVYDGHGGPEAARYVCDHLFRHLQAISAEGNGVVTEETIQRAFLETERGFTSVVSENWNSRPQLATVGACCLVGAIYQQTLFVANLGDSRVVLGKKVGNTGEIAAIQLSTEHNANIESVRWELKDLHPNDPQIVVLRHGVWRVKGIIQVSRSIGDVYLKHTRFCREPINGKFRVPQPLNMPILLATPTILEHPLHPNDSFLIFASDGLWEHLSNEKAVEIVKSHPRKGSAKRLVKAALHVAAKKREMRYSDLRNIDKKILCIWLVLLLKKSYSSNSTENMVSILLNGNGGYTCTVGSKNFGDWGHFHVLQGNFLPKAQFGGWQPGGSRKWLEFNLLVEKRPTASDSPEAVSRELVEVRASWRTPWLSKKYV